MENCSGCPYRWHDSDCAYCSARGDMVLDLTNYSKSTCEIYQREFKKDNTTPGNTHSTTTPSSKHSVFTESYISKSLFFIFVDIVVIIGCIIAMFSDGMKFKSAGDILKFIFFINPATGAYRAALAFGALMFIGALLKNIVNSRLASSFDDDDIPSINMLIYCVLNFIVISFAFSKINATICKGNIHGLSGLIDRAIGEYNTSILAKLILFFIAITVLRFIIHLIKTIKLTKHK